MPLFVMIGHDGPNGPEARNANRPAHQQNLDALDAAGRMVYAGPIRDDSGGRSVGAVVVFEAENLAAARAWVDADPYVAGGVYETLEVRAFKQAYPKSP